MIALSPAVSRVFATPTQHGPSGEACIYELSHLTEYNYDQLIQSSEHFLRLVPMQDRQQSLHQFNLKLSPQGVSRSYQDCYGNEVIHVQIHEPYYTLSIESQCLVAVYPSRNLEHNQLVYPLVWPAGEWEAMQHLMVPDALPEAQLQILRDYAFSFLTAEYGAVVPAIDAMNRAIFREFEYKPGSTQIGTSVFEIFERREGVCQDFTNLMLCLLRLLQIPAVYRTGYIFTGREVSSHIVPDASHAWVEVYLPRFGWCGWDPTNGGRAGSDHIRLAVARNSFEATPTSGTIYTPFQSETLNVHVRVKRRGATIHEL